MGCKKGERFELRYFTMKNDNKTPLIAIKAIKVNYILSVKDTNKFYVKYFIWEGVSKIGM